jgi:cephalosporin hydroxylase
MTTMFLYFIDLDFLQQSHTLRQPLFVIHDSKDSCASKCANLEVKKKSPLIGAGEL